MPTLTESLQAAVAAVNSVAARCSGLYSDMLALRDATSNNATTIINNFLGRPAVQQIWCDPVDGNDANDGLTSAASKRSLDAIVEAMGTTVTRVYLLNDATFRRRNNLNASLEIIGAQRQNAAPGFIVVQRKISVLGTAENSPLPGIGSFCSGIWSNAPSLSTFGIDFDLAEVPAGFDFRSVFHSNSGTTFRLVNGTLTVRGAGAGALVNALLGRSTVVATNITLGTGAAGHLLDGVAAGANPNNNFAYVSNLTAA